MPEFFQRLAERQVRAEVNFTRNGKPKGITYQTESGEKLAGNALGKAYSFPGLQKYLKVNYDRARDNQKLALIAQKTQQHFQSRQKHSQELDSPKSSLLQVEEQPKIEEKSQHVWEPQYGIPCPLNHNMRKILNHKSGKSSRNFGLFHQSQHKTLNQIIRES